ncbi:MAG: dihydrofolate reductase family protein [Bacteroidota bacterium]
MRNIVFSHTDTAINGRNIEVESESEDLATAIQALKNQPDKDILVYGWVEFVSSLTNLNLFDEYYIIVYPVTIGKGLIIFKEQKILKLESTITYKDGKVLNKYLSV